MFSLWPIKAGVLWIYAIDGLCQVWSEAPVCVVANCLCLRCRFCSCHLYSSVPSGAGTVWSGLLPPEQRPKTGTPPPLDDPRTDLAACRYCIIYIKKPNLNPININHNQMIIYTVKGTCLINDIFCSFAIKEPLKQTLRKNVLHCFVNTGCY